MVLSWQHEQTESGSNKAAISISAVGLMALACTGSRSGVNGTLSTAGAPLMDSVSLNLPVSVSSSAMSQQCPLPRVAVKPMRKEWTHRWSLALELRPSVWLPSALPTLSGDVSLFSTSFVCFLSHQITFLNLILLHLKGYHRQVTHGHKTQVCLLPPAALVSGLFLFHLTTLKHPISQMST